LDISPAVHDIKFGEESAILSEKINLNKEKNMQPLAFFLAPHTAIWAAKIVTALCALGRWAIKYRSSIT
jgi:hypothetical protein